MAVSDNSKIVLRTKLAERSTLCVTQTTDPEDHSELLHQLSQRIADSQREIRTFLTGSLIKAIQIGNDLIAVRELLPSGTYLQWIDEELTPISGISRRTAQRYAKLARNEDTILQRLGCNASESAPDAYSKLQAIRMEDGLRLLTSGTGSSDTERPTTDSSDISVPHVVRQIAERILHQGGHAMPHNEIPTLRLPSDDWNPKSRTSPTAIVCSPDVRCNRKAVLMLLELHNNHLLEGALLWISSHGMSQWLTLLNGFPRVCIPETSELVASSRSQWWLYGLIAPPMFETFAAAVSDLGDVLVPYTAAARSNLTTRRKKE